ncbi:MAG: hypothetical protein KIS84_12350, partial [Dokdonella sp.]|nr:hypothetical protein [Dokdonella sp.]
FLVDARVLSALADGKLVMGITAFGFDAADVLRGGGIEAGGEGERCDAGPLARLGLCRGGDNGKGSEQEAEHHSVHGSRTAEAEGSRNGLACSATNAQPLRSNQGKSVETARRHR